MMLYDEPNTAPEPQNGTGVVTEKGFFFTLKGVVLIISKLYIFIIFIISKTF